MSSLKNYVVVVPASIYARDQTRWEDPTGAGFPCFRDSDQIGFKSEAIRQGELESNGFQAWLIPLHVAEEVELPNHLSLEELKACFPTRRPWPGLHLGDKFFQSVSKLAPEFLTSVYERIATTDIPAEHVVATMQSMKRLGDPGVGFFEPSEEPIRFFEGFASFVEGLSVEDVDQVVWSYLSHPGGIAHAGPGEEDPNGYGPRFLRSMVFPFSEYLANLGGADAMNMSSFHMWWDFFRFDTYATQYPDTTVEVLREILGLPSLACRYSALHGLNHLATTEVRERVIDQFIASGSHPNDLFEYAMACRTGEAL